ncbi:MAG: DUF1851 domain-containing protein [Methylococcaceae bacterium]|nr:DUF1851 domain-containing protein [Methylococcaceae bacterium]
MPMTLDDFTVNFEHLNPATLLEDWEWLIGKAKRPILLTAFGDAFLQDAGNGSVHMLHVDSHQISYIAESVDEFESFLSDRNFVGEYFNVQIVGDLKLNGLLLKPGQIYSFKIPPVLGGQYALENVEVTSIAVHFSIAGQIGRQIKDIPPGTPITSVALKENPNPKRWWKFW